MQENTITKETQLIAATRKREIHDTSVKLRDQETKILSLHKVLSDEEIMLSKYIDERLISITKLNKTEIDKLIDEYKIEIDEMKKKHHDQIEVNSTLIFLKLFYYSNMYRYSALRF